jgi:D-alanine transaminase/branched-chain amino acid aminotransferase
LNNSLFYINGAFVSSNEASVSVTDLALQRGYGIFDFFKIINGKPIFLDDHLDRFYSSASFMQLQAGKTKSEIKNIIRHLIQQNNILNSGIRITLTGGNSSDGYSISVPNLIITQQPLQLSKSFNTNGINLVTYQHQRQLSSAKTIDYVMAIWLQQYIQQQHADDVLYHQNEIVTETPRANIFIVTKDQKIITPKHNILQGITRKHIISVAAEKFQVKEADISLTDLTQAKEVFLTSTSKQVMPVNSIDGIQIGNQNKEISFWLYNRLISQYNKS